MPRSSILAPGGAGLLAAAALLAVSNAPVRLEPGGPGWRRLVGGATPGGAVHEAGVLSLPGLDRRRPALLIIEAEAAGGGAATVGIAVDGGPLQWVSARRTAPAAILLPPARAPGARVALRRALDAAPPRLLAIRVQRDAPRRPWGAALIGCLAAAALAAGLLSRLGRDAAFALALAAGAAIALAFTPALLWLTLPAAASSLRLAPAALLLGAAAIMALRLSPLRRRELAHAAAVAGAFVFGIWVRALFLPSAGSWDTEYWKAWTARMADHGLARVYGDPEPFDRARFLARLRGEEELWKVESGGRGFVVDYPPLGMALLRGSWALVRPMAHELDGSEARNVAAKLPAVLGDMAAVAFLLAAFRRTPVRGLGLGALYWAAPPSWLSSAALGYTDGAYAPLSAAALWMAGRGRPGWTGAFVAAAGLVKPTALVVAPAAAMALWSAHASLRRAAVAGLAVVAVTLLPFAVAGTVALTVAQVFRILFQRTFSGGFANVWWIVGHVLSVSEGGDWRAPVRFVRLDTVGWPVAVIGLGLFTLATWLVLRAQREVPGPHAAALAGAALVLAYGLLAVGVHENHPHAMVLLMLAGGLASPRSRAIFAGLALTYTLNMLALSGLGRFYGGRYLLLEPWTRAWPALRVLPGFDLTLLLAALNLALFAVLLGSLREELRRAQGAAGVV